MKYHLERAGLVGLLGTEHLGGWASVKDQVSSALASANPAINPASWWSFTGAGWGAVIGMFFSAAIHTPAASIYVNYSSAARSEKTVLPAFLLGGLIAASIPFVAGWIGMVTLAKYGSGSTLSSYTLITTLATDLNPWVGGIALAAILAAVISSAGPILLASATMFVRDWLPKSASWSPAMQLMAYRSTTVIYGAIAAIIVCLTGKLSVLSLLLLGFAMVVPPAIAIGYLIYWKRTTEKGVFWGMLSGFGGGLVWYLLILYATGIQFEASPGSGLLPKLFHYCFVNQGNGIDPSYVTTLIPLIIIPVISLLTKNDEKNKAAFYRTLATHG